MNNTLGWGVVSADGAEIWDAEPVFAGDFVTRKDWFKLLFYPKKFLLYRVIQKARKHLPANRLTAQAGWQAGKNKKANSEPFRVLDVGCGTGATLIDLKRMLGRGADVVGVDVVKLQVDLARTKISASGVWAEAEWYDGAHLPFADNSFDVVYSSDVLGHVKEVRPWLAEIYRVLKPGGTLTMFSESSLGKHAWIRKYLFNRGLNIDPHAEFHISLFSKTTIREFLEATGFNVKKMYSVLWAAFLVHPDEFYPALQGQSKFFWLRLMNKALYHLKKKTHPYSTAAAELYTLGEMLTLGRVTESQGYIVLAKKDDRETRK